MARVRTAGTPRSPAPTFVCEECGTLRECAWQAYNRRFHRKQRFCSGSCSQKFLQKGRRCENIEIPTFICERCGTETKRSVWELKNGKHRINHKQKYCSKVCSATGRVYDRPSEGFTHCRTGYRYLLEKGKAIAEHRRVMETMLGRPLKKHETVHHRDGQRTNNDPSNLELWSKNHGPGQRVSDLIPYLASDYMLGAMSLGG